jgi:hypothetical protein
MILLRVLGQSILLLIVLLVGSLLIWERIPGNGSICDPGQHFYFVAWVIFIGLSSALIINSWFFLKRNHWKQYRIAALTIVTLLLMIAFSIRPMVFSLTYGNEKYVLENQEESFEQIKLKLYENEKFFSWTYDMGCQIENTGTYTFEKGRIVLSFDNKKSDYIGTEYLIADKRFVCVKGCEVKNELVVKTSP